MSPIDIRAAVLDSLKSVAPEADLAAVHPGADLRQTLDIDSMDFLRFVVSLNDTLHVDIPERDYPKVRTLDGCIAYLTSHLG